MIHVHKMGLSYYANGIDKNSGMTELQLIVDEIKNIETFDKNILIIINGIRDESDNKLFELIKESDISIFIMSDSIALETSLDIMNACDYVLHQAPYHIFNEIKVPQKYSYVPELFYKYCRTLLLQGVIKLDSFKSPKIYFGGNNKNRDDKFKTYKINEAPNIFSRYKLYETGKDTRISHNEYLKELSKFAYSLVICREDYRRIGWITSRYFEAIALGNIPLIDYEYDTYCFLIGLDSFLRVSSYESLTRASKFLNSHSEYSELLLTRLRKDAELKITKFKELIEKIIEEN